MIRALTDLLGVPVVVEKAPRALRRADLLGVRVVVEQAPPMLRRRDMRMPDRKLGRPRTAQSRTTASFEPVETVRAPG